MTTVIAWAGGAAFAATLGYLVYFYAILLASPMGARGGDLVGAVLLDVLLFSVFALHHSLFARARAKRWVAARVSPALERTAYVWIASALLIGVCLAWQPVGGLLYRADGGLRWLLLGVQLGGVALTVRATRAIDGLALAGIRTHESQELAGSHEARPARDETISHDGPYGLVRHPIYLGWVLMVGATPMMTANRLLFVALSVGYVILAIPWEERSLVAAHGARYRAYQQAVRWRLVPGVW